MAVAGEPAQWGVTDHLLAAVIDVLQIGNWQYASAHSKTRVKRPQPLRRPGENELGKIGGRSRGYSIEELRRRLDESNGPNSPYITVEATTI